jgi:pimeloyl-ACP methyl ester carboxylesterase
MSEAIHVNRWGTGSPVLLVHGGSQGGPAGGEDQWSAQRPLADEGWELVLPDRPGHGRSPSRGPEDFELDAVWAAELLGDGAHLVGHSYGAVIALYATCLRPEAVRSLTLIEPPIFSVAAGDPDVEAFRARLARASATKNPLLALGRLMRTLKIPMRQMEPKPTPKHIFRMAKHFQTMRPPDTWDASAAVASVNGAEIPVLVVTGGWSPGFEVIADRLAEQTGGRRLIIRAGHHFPQMAGEPAGDEFNQALRTFLRQHDDRLPGAS